LGTSADKLEQMGPAMAKKKIEKPRRTAPHRVVLTLTDEEKKAFDLLVQKERRDKTAILKYALYQYCQEQGIDFPPDGKYIV